MRSSFKSALLSAAEAEFNVGRITRFQLRLINATALFRPWKIRQCEAFVVDEAVKAGKIGDASAVSDGFDWNALLEFIRELLPIILEIISWFN